MVRKRNQILWLLKVLGWLLLASCGGPGVPLANEIVDEPGLPRTLAEGATTTDRVLELLEDDATFGTFGLYLREIDGPVHASLNHTFTFEPASTIKALVHFHALRWVQDGVGGVNTIDSLLDDTIIVRNTAQCPAGNESEPLRTALTEMMRPSSNFWTRALQDYFGDGSIDATRGSLGMTNTQLQRILGCGGHPTANPPDPNQPSNHLTLVDAGTMYERAATDFLNDDIRTVGFPGQLMVTHQSLLEPIIDEEAVGLGLSSGAVSAFKAQ